MNPIIKEDLFRYKGSAGFPGFIRGFMIPGFRYLFFLRKVSSCVRYSPAWFIYGFLKRWYSYTYGFQIPAKTRIGKGLYIGHHGTIVINGRSSIGDYCNIAHNVTIGQTNRGKRKGYPSIGNFVWIGTGAVIVGNITIGSNVLIAPNSYVNVDVPDFSIVMGNPCQIISHPNPCEGYIEYIPEKD